MSKRIKAIFFIFFFSFLNSLWSCSKTDYDSKSYFDVRKMNVWSVTRYKDYPAHWEVNVSTFCGDYKYYRLLLDFTDSILYYSEGKKNNFNFFNSAQASHYGDGKLGSKEIISGIYTTSNADYDSLHLAGDTLNDIFNAKQYLDSIGYKGQQTIEFRLSKLPTISLSHKFTVHYFQTNGEHYWGSTSVTF